MFVGVVALALLAACEVDDNVRGPGFNGGVPALNAGGSASGGAVAPMAGTGGEPMAGVPAGGPVLPAAGEGGMPPLASAGAEPVAGEGGTPVAGAPPERIFDAGDPSLNNVQAGAVCQRLAQIQCAGEVYCCDNPGRDRAACEQAQYAGCANDLHLDAVSANAIVAFDAAAASAAYNMLQTLASQCDPMIATYGASAAGLLSMFHGTVEAGKSCRPAGLDEAGAAAALASCADPVNNACLPANALSWSCTPRGGVGQPCFTDLNCQEGLMCPNPNLSFGEVACAPRKPAGSPCQLANECESIACKGGVCAPVDAQSAYCLLD